MLDPCKGKGNMSAPWVRRGAKPVWHELDQGRNFLETTRHHHVDLIVCNPPWSTGGDIRYSHYVWWYATSKLFMDDLDKFVFISDRPRQSPIHEDHQQHHAVKQESYFWVFRR